MLPWVAALAGAAAACSGSSSSQPSEPANLAGIVAGVNQIRASVAPAASPALAPLQWDPTLAAEAQKIASDCRYEVLDNNNDERLHGHARWATLTDSTPAQAVATWAAEAADFDYANFECKGTPPHRCQDYEAIAYRRAARVGCGVAECVGVFPLAADETPTRWQNWQCSFDFPTYIGPGSPLY